jgi:NAD(P)-dependent dehydrogenase (short-subunit alcohol dehydrogenase family)
MAELELMEYLPEDLFDGTVVFITGGGSGINLGIARAFATLGADLAICGRSVERLEGAAAELEELGAQVVAVPADVRDYDALAHAMEAARDELGPIGVLVCGAAGNFPCRAEELSANGFKAVVDIDLLGSFNACRAAFDQLAETRGSIVFISAGQAFVPYPAQVHVGAAKAGVDNLMRNLALEWGRFGIRSNSIAPGPIEGTEGMRRLGPDDPTYHDRLKTAIPLGRYGRVEEIGAAAVFLASPMASYVSGTLLVVDGGQNLMGSYPFGRLLQEAMGNDDDQKT